MSFLETPKLNESEASEVTEAALQKMFFSRDPSASEFRAIRHKGRWRAWVSSEVGPSNLTRIQRHGSPVGSANITVKGIVWRCFEFDRHEDGGLAQVWNAFLGVLGQ